MRLGITRVSSDLARCRKKSKFTYEGKRLHLPERLMLSQSKGYAFFES